MDALLAGGYLLVLMRSLRGSDHRRAGREAEHAERLAARDAERRLEDQMRK